MPKNSFELKILGEKVEAFKKKKNLTYQQMGELSGIDKSYIHRIVKRNSSPSFSVVMGLAKLMNLPTYSLLVPSEEQLTKEYASIAQKHLEEKNWTIEELHKKTSIPHLKLKDILKGVTTPTKAECSTLSKTLEINDLSNYQEGKMAILEDILDGMLGEEQKKNVMEYIKENML